MAKIDPLRAYSVLMSEQRAPPVAAWTSFGAGETMALQKRAVQPNSGFQIVSKKLLRIRPEAAFGREGAWFLEWQEAL